MQCSTTELRRHFEQVTEIASVYSRWQRDASLVGLTCKLPESSQLRSPRWHASHRSPAEAPAGRSGRPCMIVEVRASRTSGPTVPNHVRLPLALHLEISWVVRDSNSAHRFKRPVHRRNAYDPFVPPPGIEPEPPGLQPSAQTFYARVASVASAAPRAAAPRFVVVLFGCHAAPSSPCLSGPAVGNVDHERCSRRGSALEGSNSHFQSQSLGVLPIERTAIE